jgi:cyclophilin family peptidyl-prolyl cis-trans isomerase
MKQSVSILIIGAVIVFGLITFLGPGKTSIIKPISPTETPKDNVLPASTELSPTPTESLPTVTSKPMNQKKSYSQAPAMTIDANKSYLATLNTSKGTMKIALFAKETPVTVNNFVFLAREGFYNNTVFHRIIKGFMIQGGDPEGTGRGGPGYKFNDEPINKDYVRGVLAMANSGPNTNGSQFFIMHADNALPKNYVIFGAIDPSDSASLTTLDAIASTPVGDNGMGENSKPSESVTINSVAIVEK